MNNPSDDHASLPCLSPPQPGCLSLEHSQSAGPQPGGSGASPRRGQARQRASLGRRKERPSHSPAGCGGEAGPSGQCGRGEERTPHLSGLGHHLSRWSARVRKRLGWGRRRPPRLSQMWSPHIPEEPPLDHVMDEKSPPATGGRGWQLQQQPPPPVNSRGQSLPSPISSG